MNHPQQVFADSADVDNLLGRVAQLERTQLAEDVDGFLALFKPDAVWVPAGSGGLPDENRSATLRDKYCPARSRTPRCVTTWRHLLRHSRRRGHRCQPAVHRLRRASHQRGTTDLRLDPSRRDMAHRRRPKHRSR